MRRLIIVSVNEIDFEENSHVIYYLKELHKYAYWMTVCVPDFISEDEECKVQRYADTIFRCGTIFDANRYRAYLKQVKESEFFAKIDEIIFANDSIYGPLYDMKYVFEPMDDDKACDYWGITAHSAMEYEKDGQLYKNNGFIQTYFFGVRKSMFQAACFWQFWDELPEMFSYEQQNACFEIAFSDFFGERGYRSVAFCDTSMWDNDDSRFFVAHILFSLDELIRKHDYPFFPKAVFDILPEVMQSYNDGSDIKRALLYVQEHTEYDVKMIYRDLLRRKNVYEIYRALNLNYIVDSDKSYPYRGKKTVAVFVYLYYEDLFPELVNRILDIPVYIDVYIATDKEWKKEKIISYIQKAPKKRRHRIRYGLNAGKGRDLAALLVTFHEYLLQYDLICFCHDKKSAQLCFTSAGRCFNDNLWGNMLDSPAFIENVIEYFEKEPLLGFLTAPMVNHNIYFHTDIDSWTICFDKTLEVADRLKIPIRISQEFNPLALGSCFWARTKALQKLFRYPFSYDDFPDEPMPVDGTISHAIERMFPYVAQEAGFYTGVLMSTKYASLYYTNKTYALNQIMRLLDMPGAINTATLKSTLDSLREYLKEENI